MKYRLNWGTHRVFSGKAVKVYNEGDMIETTAMLDQQFQFRHKGKWKFELVDETNENSKPNIPVIKRSPSEDVEGGPEQPPSTNIPDVVVEQKPSEFKEVTDDFPRAEKMNVQVFSNGKTYIVRDPGTNKILNIDKLVKLRDVNLFLKQYGK